MEAEGERVNHMRTDQFLETDAATVAVSCPFCIQMFDDGVPAVQTEEEGRIRPFDVAELLEQAVFGPATAAPVAAGVSAAIEDSSADAPESEAEPDGDE